MSGTTLATERNRNIVSGAIGLLLLVGSITVGIKASFGAFDGGYELTGTFAAAGQGLLPGSDVKIRGVNVGEVRSIRLVDNRARITMRIEDGTDVPAATQAVIRPKTLFGEKFVDLLPGETEMTGPFLADGDVIEDTLGGFELEQVLADTFPVLEAIDPAELAVVLDELATGAEGLGPNVNRTLQNAAALSDLAVSNDAEFRQFTDDLALLSETLDELSPDLIRGAQDLAVALPALNENSDRLNEALTQASRLAGDVADLLEANEPFTTKALTDGGRTLQLLFDERSQLQPLLAGITGYTQTLAEAIRFEVGDGTMMAAVKNLISVQELIGGVAPPAAAGGSAPAPAIDALSGLGGTVDDLLGPTVNGLLRLLAGGAG